MRGVVPRSRVPSGATALAIASMLLATSCGTGPTDLAAGSPTPTVEQPPSESPSPVPSPTQTGTREPYTDYSVYRSDDRRGPNFSLEHPSEWTVQEPPDQPFSVRTYSFFDYEPVGVRPAVEGCPSRVKIELVIAPGRSMSDVADFPEPQEERSVAGEVARMWIFTGEDPTLKEINDLIDTRRCMKAAGGADLVHGDALYSLRLYTTLERPQHDLDAFERMLDTFAFA